MWQAIGRKSMDNNVILRMKLKQKDHSRRHSTAFKFNSSSIVRVDQMQNCMRYRCHHSHCRLCCHRLVETVLFMPLSLKRSACWLRRLLHSFFFSVPRRISTNQLNVSDFLVTITNLHGKSVGFESNVGIFSVPFRYLMIKRSLTVDRQIDSMKTANIVNGYKINSVHTLALVRNSVQLLATARI